MKSKPVIISEKKDYSSWGKKEEYKYLPGMGPIPAWLLSVTPVLSPHHSPALPKSRAEPTAIEYAYYYTIWPESTYCLVFLQG